MRCATRLRDLLLVSACLLGCAAHASSSGEAIFRQGVLPDGALLRGERAAGTAVEGAAAACVACHHRSGLGGIEGRFSAPPIIGRYLFRSHLTNIHDSDLPHVPNARVDRPAYTSATLAAAIRDGVNSAGRPLSYLMPRYALDTEQMNDLVAYLQQLTSAPVPGVSDDTLQFATIVTPDSAPATRAAMLEVMTKFFEDKNAFQRGGTRRMQAIRQVDYRVTRRWQLHVWELAGPPETWVRQLHARLKADPVFAVLGGLGGRTWAPVHQFCEQAELPCLFPNVDVPVVAEDDFYNLYFSRGVGLEADLVRQYLTAAGGAGVLQIYREGDIGADAAARLARTMATTGRHALRTLVLRANAGTRADVAAAVAAARSGEAIVLWLRPDDLAALGPARPRPGPAIMSGLMGGWENAPLPGAWRGQTRMTYPVDLPDARKARMNYALGWFKIRQIALVDEHVQTDTYVACSILAEALNDMLDGFVRDYLVERIEAMLGHRVVNGFYQTLGLGPKQRFASKGGYVVRFASSGNTIVADGEWTVPDTGPGS